MYKNESNILIFSKDIERKPFVAGTDGTYGQRCGCYKFPIENGRGHKSETYLLILTSIILNKIIHIHVLSTKHYSETVPRLFNRGIKNSEEMSI